MRTRTSIRPLIVAITVLILTVTVIGSLTVQAAENPVPEKALAEAQSTTRTLTVSGWGGIAVAPDTAQISLGVETHDPKADRAQAANNQIMQKVIASIKALNVPDNRIRTSRLNLYPVRDFEKNRSQGEIVGYTATNRVTVTVPVGEFEKLGPIMDAAIAAGANTVDGISFSIRNDDELAKEALKKAIADARSKADVIAESLGVEIVGVISAGESSGGTIYPEGRGIMYSAVDLAVPTPVLPGELSVTAGVTITYEIR